MTQLSFPKSPEALAQRLNDLHQERKNLPPPFRRRSLRPKERSTVLAKTAGRCHLCGGEITERKFAADHVLSHAAGGPHELDNYLPAHGVCNGSRWFYSAEEFQWILRMGVWARKQMEDRTAIGKKMVQEFFRHEEAVRKRRKE